MSGIDRKMWGRSLGAAAAAAAASGLTEDGKDLHIKLLWVTKHTLMT